MFMQDLIYFCCAAVQKPLYQQQPLQVMLRS